ncbi:MAG TPA: aspartate/glutamate racemase family protein, partial [Anaerolineaceae bacterium]
QDIITFRNGGRKSALMKTIGMIGGMSWESSLEYYRLVNEMVKVRLGGLHSAKCIMVSVDFAEIEEYQHNAEWDKAGDVLAAAACSLERGGADCVVLCTNTMHKVVEAIQAAVQIPLLHIADATAKKVLQSGLGRVGLLGTRFTMEEDFYVNRLVGRFGLQVIIPEEKQRTLVHRVIFDELVLGQIKSESRLAYREVIKDLVRQGAEGVILGCTEIGMLVKPEDSAVPLFDTTYLHAQAAVDFSLGNL